MRIERFDPRTDDKRLKACHDMTVAGSSEDEPNLPPMLYGQFRGWWAYGFGDNPMQAWLASADSGEPVGGYLLELPQKENRANAFAHAIVGPSWRRRGIGTTLLAHMAERSAESGRSLLMSETRIGSPGNAFAGATGATAGLREVRRTLEVDEPLRSRLPGLRASAERHAAGYALRNWCGPAPEELVEGLCATFTDFGDAPHDKMFEPAIWDPARLRASDERVKAQGTRLHAVAAVIAGTGEVAALTQLTVDPGRPNWGWQELTAVTRQHRGHRLGLLVKVAMLELLAVREPGLRRIVTSNGQSNEHMVSINEQLGYQVSDHTQGWSHDVGAARSLARAGQS